MKPTIRVLTLGVSDLDRSLAFYRDGLGLPTDGIIGQEFEHGSVVFFNLKNGLILALFPTDFLSKERRLPQRRRDWEPCPSVMSLVRKKRSMR